MTYFPCLRRRAGLIRLRLRLKVIWRFLMQPKNFRLHWFYPLCSPGCEIARLPISFSCPSLREITPESVSFPVSSNRGFISFSCSAGGGVRCWQKLLPTRTQHESGVVPVHFFLSKDVDCIAYPFKLFLIPPAALLCFETAPHCAKNCLPYAPSEWWELRV